ncbi:MAG TPA: hypothetical protein VE010_01055, partial [Thermoanaerobaculia bacterium]|nr:hypothetical protein [Thermoanaerobaculia bacterium]
RLRSDARPLRHQPDEQTLARIRQRIHEHIAQVPPRSAPTSVVELLAAWFRPLAAAAVAIALTASAGVVAFQRNDLSFQTSAIEVSVEGETFRVAD